MKKTLQEEKERILQIMKTINEGSSFEDERNDYRERIKNDKDAWFSSRNITPEQWHDYEGEMGDEEVSYEDYLKETNRPIDSLLDSVETQDDKDHFQNMQLFSVMKAYGFGDDFRRTYKKDDYYYLVDTVYDINGNPGDKNHALWGVSRDGSHSSLHAN
jgi:hypothetical protein